MDQKKILDTKGGMDVLSPETEIPPGRVRVAENVILHNDGGFDLRAGATLSLSLAGVRSMWQTADGSLTLCAAGTTLYKLDGTADDPIATSIATLGGTGHVRYAELAGNVYVSCGDILRIAPDGVVTRPGVASLMGTGPSLSTTTGALPAGTYGVAFSAVNSRGEESGLSDVEYIVLASPGGILVDLPDTAPGEATSYRIYRSAQNGGDDLRLVDTIPCAASYTIAGGETGRLAVNYMLDLLPAGNEIAGYKGRLYSALGSYLFYSPPFNHGLCNMREGFIPFPAEITMVQPVEGGIFVGTRANIYFLSGNGPGAFQLERAAANGAFMHSPRLVDAKMFNEKLVDTAKHVGLWLSPLGYQLGLPSGAVASPQADRMLIADVERAPTLAFLLGGVRQVVSALETVTLGNGGATDTTP